MKEEKEEGMKKRKVTTESSTSLKHIIQTTAKILREHTPHEKKKLRPLKERIHKKNL